MASYPPPSELTPVFNPLYYTYTTVDGGITRATADSLYVSLSKSQGINGSKTFNAPLTANSIVDINDTTQSTSHTTGCLVLSGGLGVQKATHINGTLHLDAPGSELQMSGLNSHLIMSGSNGYASIANTSASTSSTTGALRVAGGIYAGANSLLNADLSFAKSGFTNTVSTSVLTANRTTTLPNASGIVVLENNSQTLSNKILGSLRVSSNGTTITQIRTGSASTPGIIPANFGQDSQSVTFSPAFATVPKVVATISNYNGSNVLNACLLVVGNVSTSGATFYVTNAFTSDTTSVATVDWIAWTQ